MTQVTSGVRHLLAHPRLYDLAQTAFGAYRAQAEIAEKYLLVPADDATIVDIGCGTARILDNLPGNVKYFGFDLSETYVARAREAYGHRATFECGDVATFADGPQGGTADLVVALGVLHHLDDSQADSLFATARAALRNGGRLVTVDPTFTEGQSRSSKFLVARDRGLDVRSPQEYRKIADQHFSSIEVNVRHDLIRIPYSHAILQCTK